MSKVLKVEVYKTFYTNVFIVVPDDFNGSTAAYSQAITEQANHLTPGIHMRPWKEDRDAFDFDSVFQKAAPHEIEHLGLQDASEDKPD
jgi:hypothetical protein